MLHLHTAARIEPLARHLAEVLSVAPADPMTPEWIAVPSEGMRRWLNLELARHLGAGPAGGDGVAANIRSGFPASLRLQVLDAGVATDEGDPWRVEHLVWAVLAELVNAVDPLLQPLQRVPAGSSRYGRARRIADLFDRYHLHRTDMVLAWSEGADVDGSGRSLPAHQRWQPSLWRRVRARIGAASPPERLPDLLAGLHDGSLQVDLPDRLAMFGLSVLPGGAGFLDLADAVGATRELHVFMVEPSPAAAARVAEQLEPGGLSARLRSEDNTASLVRHPLVRSWGRLHRESTVLLVDGERQGVPPAHRLPDEPSAHGSERTLLGRLQADLRLDRAPSADLAPADDDRSIQLHSTHGATRQVEVLRDVLLHLLADDELALVEDDIVVVSPSLATMAPVIQAVFGPSVEHGGRGTGSTPGLRYRIADRSLRSATPLLEALEAVLALVAGRFDAPSVLDLVSLGPVRNRFGFTDDDVARITEWVLQANVRWGLDEHQRERAGLPATFDTNTWRAALDRLMLGLANDDEHQLGLDRVAPIPLSTEAASLAGRLAELLWRLDELAGQVGTERPVAAWLDLVRAAAEHLLAVPRDERWQVDALTRTLGEVQASAALDPAMADVPLEFVDLRRLLADRLDAAPGRPDFFRGGVTISSMTPLRGVPHRVVVLLGVDQPAFAVGAPDGDDLAAATPLLGDRDGRGESRLSLLEAVLSARERLVLIREGHDVRTNQPVPRSVPVAELVDAVLDMVDPAHRKRVADRLEVQHPRQPFDERNFLPGKLVPGTPWGFDRGAHHGAAARRRRDDTPHEFMSEPLAPLDEPVIELAQLHSFLKDPLAQFVHRRLGVRLPRREESPAPLIPLDVGPLDRWKVGDRLFNWLLDGGDVESWELFERRLGTLGPGAFGDATVAEVRQVALALVDAATANGVRPGPARSVPVDVTLPDGTRVVGMVEDRLEGRPGPARLTYSKIRPAYRLAAWLDLLALTASAAEVPWRSLGVHQHQGKQPVALVDLDLLAPSDDPPARRAAATAALEVVVDCYRRGSVEPVPLFPSVSHEVWAGRSGESEWIRAGGGGDGAKPPASLVYGGRDFRDLARQPRRPGDPVTRSGPGASRLVCFAEYLWDAFDASAVDTGESPAESDEAAS